MGIKTKIDWCDSSVNPMMGCLGCELWNPPEVQRCYAALMSRHRAGHKGFPADFSKPQLFPGRMAQAAAWKDLTGTKRPGKPWLDGMPRAIFIGDMGDVFAYGAGQSRYNIEAHKHEIINVVLTPQGQRHIWILCTKRPWAMCKLSDSVDWPDNLVAMTTVTSQETIGRLDWLGQCSARYKAVSLEPLLGPVDIAPYTSWLDWVIVGGANGPGARRMDPGWVDEVHTDCESAGVPYFFKGMGSWYDKQALGGDGRDLVQLRCRRCDGSGLSSDLESNCHVCGGDGCFTPNEFATRKMPRIEVSDVSSGMYYRTAPPGLKCQCCDCGHRGTASSFGRRRNE